MSKEEQLDNLLKQEKEWTAMFDSDVRVGLALLEEIRKLGYKEVAEIISYSFMEPKDVIETSMKNDKNKILDEKFTNIGCGMSLSQNGKLYWCIHFAS